MTSEQCGKGIIPRSLILTDEFLVEGWSVVAVIFKLWSDIFGGNLCLFVTQFTKYGRPLFRMRFSIIPRSKLVLSAHTAINTVIVFLLIFFCSFQVVSFCW